MCVFHTANGGQSLYLDGAYHLLGGHGDDGIP